jgi:hypothetical protein
MHVAFDKAGHKGLALSVNHLGVLTDETIHIGSFSHGDDLSILCGNSAIFNDGEIPPTLLDFFTGNGNGVYLGMPDYQIGLWIPFVHDSPSSSSAGRTHSQMLSAVVFHRLPRSQATIGERQTTIPLLQSALSLDPWITGNDERHDLDLSLVCRLACRFS